MNARRLLLAVACAVAGAAVSLCTLALHGYWWGLLLGLAATAATMVALPGGAPRLGFAVGWVLLLVPVASVRAEGDYVVAGNVNGYALLAGGLAALLGGFVGLGRRPAQNRD